jgi:hypothetical protein
MKKTCFMAIAFATMSLFASVSEIKVDFKLDFRDYVLGERIRGVVDIVNSSPETIGDGASGLNDQFFIEVFNSKDLTRLDRKGKGRFIAPFYLRTGEGQKFEAFLDDHYNLSETRRYLAKPVLVRKGIRYEGEVRAFDIVEGVKLSSAMQMFSTSKSLQRNFTLSYWSRRGSEHLFLSAADTGLKKHVFETRDLGPLSRLDKPIISIMPNGSVVVFHRVNSDQFIRSEFWSLPNNIEFRSRNLVADPETAGTATVRELYRKEGVKPKVNPWWKFW